MQFGVGLSIAEFTTAIDLLRIVDESGFSMMWVPDVQSLRKELYVSLTVAALHTKQIKLAAGVTNPITRHPAITASAIASIDELSGGRAVLSIGTGDSAVYNLGLKPARLEALKEFVLALKALRRHHEPLTRDTRSG